MVIMLKPLSHFPLILSWACCTHLTKKKIIYHRNLCTITYIYYLTRYVIMQYSSIDEKYLITLHIQPISTCVNSQLTTMSHSNLHLTLSLSGARNCVSLHVQEPLPTRQSGRRKIQTTAHQPDLLCSGKYLNCTITIHTCTLYTITIHTCTLHTITRVLFTLYYTFCVLHPAENVHTFH